MDGYFYYYRRPKLSDKNYAVISTIVFLFLKDQVSSNYFADYVGFPMRESMLEPYNLVQRKCISNTKVYKDVLIYKIIRSRNSKSTFLTSYAIKKKLCMMQIEKEGSTIELNLLFRFVYKHYLDDKYSSMAMAAILPAPIAEITVAAPVTASPPA